MLRELFASLRSNPRASGEAKSAEPEEGGLMTGEEEKYIEVEGTRYSAFQVLVMKRALEEEISYRSRTAYDLVRLASRYLFRDLRVSEQEFERLTKLAGTPTFQALFILDALHKTRDIEGDVCEYGVAQGRTSGLIATRLGRTEGGKRLWLYNSFEGLPKPSAKDILLHDLYGLGDMAKYEGMFSLPEDLARAEIGRSGLAPDRVTICKGWIEAATLADRSPRKISFSYLDMDLYQSTKDVLALLIERMPAGGIAVVDDFEFFSSGVKTAIEETMSEFPGAFSLDRPFDDKFAVLTRC